MAKNLDSGASLSAPFAHFDRASSSWKTCQPSLFEALAESPLTWPTAGIASRGRASALTTLEGATDASGSSSLRLPTPTAQDYNPAFVEWMMGFPEGWTAMARRRDRLRMLGNAAQPQAVMAAWCGLMDRLAPRVETEARP